MKQLLAKYGQPAAGLVTMGFGLLLVARIYATGQFIAAIACLVALAVGAFVYTSERGYNFRYLFPGLLATLVFVIFPIVYTFAISFTNYSSRNLLTYERAKQYFLAQTFSLDEDQSYGYTLHSDGTQFRLRLENLDGKVFLSAPVSLGKSQTVSVEVVNAVEADAKLAEAIETKAVIQQLPKVKLISVKLPDGQVLSVTGLRQFGAVSNLYEANADGSLSNLQDKSVAKPNFKTGFFESDTGEQLTPGFTVKVGWNQYLRIFSDDSFSEPFVRIFMWTVAFAALTVLFAFSVGIVLAVLMSWEALRFRSVYQTLLFIPYTVPAFISILIFKGLFNQNTGEINQILSMLFGISPSWFSTPVLAKAMLLIVNTWLGFPYMMVLCLGLLKSIPADLYEASAIAGAGPLTNFFKITLPLIIKPITPLLIASFAFNFNNVMLIALLTGGRPDFLDTKVPAGTTDLLVSFTYRIAFEDAGANFGLAAAISTILFLMVMVLSIINMRLTKINAQEAR
jgi:maltose/maltodextrin transport system permease protein